MDDRQKAGLLIFIGGALFLTGLHLAEMLYPGYSVSENYISDLGVGPEPSALIFNASVFLFGLLGTAGAYFLWRDRADRVLPILLAISGLGAMGVGMIHEGIAPWHFIVSALAFLFTALVALLSYRLVGIPLGYLSAVLGMMSLAAMALFASDNYLCLGHGGMERMILYPALAWIIGLGGLLAGNMRIPGKRLTGRAH